VRPEPALVLWQPLHDRPHYTHKYLHSRVHMNLG
jgi:hypothetical protein